MKIRIIIVAAMLCLSVQALHAQQISLQDCLQLSSQNDPYLRNSQLDLDAARTQLHEARLEFLPRLAVTSYAYYALEPLIRLTPKDILGNSDAANNINNEFNAYAQANGLKTVFTMLHQGYGVSASAMQPIYAGGRIVNGNRLAALGVEAAQVQARIKIRDTRTSVEQKYWQVVALQEKMETVRQGKQLLAGILSDAEAAAQAGLIPSSDVAQVKIRQAELESAEIRLRSGIKLAKMDIFNAIGLEYRYLELDSMVFSDPIDMMGRPSEYIVPADEMEEPDESRLLSLQVEAGKLEKRMAVGENLPQLSVGAGYGYNSLNGFEPGKFNGLGFIMLQIPITDAGKAALKAKRYGYKVEKAANEREYLNAQLRLRDVQLQLGMESAWEQLQVSAEAVEIAEDAVARATADREAGRITLSSQLQAEMSLRTAMEEYIDRCIDYRLAVREYLNLQNRP